MPGSEASGMRQKSCFLQGKVEEGLYVDLRIRRCSGRHPGALSTTVFVSLPWWRHAAWGLPERGVSSCLKCQVSCRPRCPGRKWALASLFDLKCSLFAP